MAAPVAAALFSDEGRMLGSGARLAWALLACAMTAVSAAAAGAVPDVVVTVKPLHALVARVMAGTGTPQLLVRGASSAHTYALKPSDVKSLNAAGLFFRMSETMEPFTARVVKALPQRVQVVTLQETPGLELLARRTGALLADEGAGHGHHKHGPIDGHAWLDPANAGVMAGRIAEALSAADPEHAPVFRANAEALKRDLAALDAELAHGLAPVAGRPFIVLHDALQYFERRYGLKSAGAIVMNPEVPPSARRLSALRSQVAAGKAQCVFAEPQLDGRLVDAVVEGTPARKATLDPEGIGIEPGPELYFTLLRNLARDLRACLAPG
jgi:zinc transport system substrate-binding protein